MMSLYQKDHAKYTKLVDEKIIDNFVVYFS